MTYFKEDWIALLEYNEEHKEKLWHYNYGRDKPDTYGWRGVFWYNHEDRETSRFISEFCDCIDEMVKGVPTYQQVLKIAEFVNQYADKNRIRIKLYQ